MAKKFDHEIYQLASSIPSISSAEEVYNCLNKLETYNDDRIMGNFLLLLICFNFYNLIK